MCEAHLFKMCEAHEKLSLVLQVSQYNPFLISKIKCPLSNGDEVEGMHFRPQKGGTSRT